MSSLVVVAFSSAISFSSPYLAFSHSSLYSSFFGLLGIGTIRVRGGILKYANPNCPIEEPHPSRRIRLVRRFFLAFFLPSRRPSAAPSCTWHGRPLRSPERIAPLVLITSTRRPRLPTARSQTTVSRRITAAAVPTLYRPRVSGGGGVRVGTELVCTRLARSHSLSPSLSLSLSAGKVDLSGGRSYYLLFSLSTTRGRSSTR